MSAHEMACGESAGNPRFAQVLVPSDVADVGHGDTVKDDGHVGGGALVAVVACVASDIIRLMIDARTETKSSEGEGEDGQTEDKGNEGVFKDDALRGEVSKWAADGNGLAMSSPESCQTCVSASLGREASTPLAFQTIARALLASKRPSYGACSRPSNCPTRSSHLACLWGVAQIACMGAILLDWPRWAGRAWQAQHYGDGPIFDRVPCAAAAEQGGSDGLRGGPSQEGAVGDSGQNRRRRPRYGPMAGWSARHDCRPRRAAVVAGVSARYSH